MTAVHDIRLRLLIAAATLLVLVMAAMAAMGGAAYAAQTTTCENPSGNQVQGNCQGQALNEVTRNPAGKAPPGQNK